MPGFPKLPFGRVCLCAGVSSVVHDETARSMIRLAYFYIDQRYPEYDKRSKLSATCHGFSMLRELAQLLQSMDCSCGVVGSQLADTLDVVSAASEKRRRFIPEVVDAAVAVGFLKEEPFVEWYEKNRTLLLESRAPGKAIVGALRGSSYRSTFVRKAKSSAGKERVYIIRADVDDAFCFGVLREFLDSGMPNHRYETGEIRCFYEHFSESLGFTPASMDDFTVESFTAQIHWFNDHTEARLRTGCMRLVAEFYRFIISLLPDDQTAFTYATGLTEAALVHQQLPALWVEGYRAVIYNPLDPVPSSCKWLLFPNEEETRGSSYIAGKPYLVDLETHADFQQLLIDWVWLGGLSATSIRRAGVYCKSLIEAIANEGIAVISNARKIWHVDQRCVSDSLARHAASDGSSQMRSIRFWFRSFLEFGADRGALAVDRGCLLLLEAYSRARGETMAKEIDAVASEDLVSLAKVLERRSAESLFDELVYAVFCTQALTSLRISEILTLRVNDISEGTRPGIYVIRRTSKTSGVDSRDTQIPKSIFDLLMAVVAATQQVRSDAAHHVKDYVFIKPRNLSSVSVLAVREYRSTLKKICESEGLESVTPSSVRKRYMTEVVEQGIRANLSRLALKPLTGHSNEAITNEYYLREDIRSYLEAVHGIEIGKPRIAGDIVQDSLIAEGSEHDVVEGGAGICRNEFCNIPGTATCLLCKGFMTAPQFIPQMEEALAVVQRQIEKAPSQHDRDHLVAVKRLYLAYLGKMLELVEGECVG